MKKGKDQSNEAFLLREKVSELELLRIELQLQNEKLLLAAENAKQIALHYENLYKEICDFSPAGYFRLNHDGIICNLNESGAKLLCKERAELENKNFLQFIAPESIPVFSHFFHEIFKTGSKQSCEVCLSPHENSTRYVLFEGIFLGNENKYLVTAVDITGRKQIEKALQKSEMRHRLLADNASDVIWTMDINGCYTYISPSVIKLRGYTAEEVMQQSMSEVLTVESAFIAQTRLNQAYDEVRKGSSIKEFNSELEQRCKDGSTVWTDVTSSAMYDPAGEFIGILGVSRNITERKRAEEEQREREEKHRILLDESSDPIFTFNSEGQYRYVNKAFASGVELKQEDIIGRKIWDIFPKDEAEKRFAVVRWVFEKGVSKVIEVRVPKADRDLWYITTVKPILNEKGKVVTVICISKDITERKRAETSLKESEANLRELNSTKDKFFSIIAHDLKNPFNSIIGLSDLLYRKVQVRDYEGIGSYSQMIRSSSQRALNLLTNLLSWACIQTGRMEFIPECIDLVELTNEVMVLLDNVAQQKSITVSTQFPPLVFVVADKEMISTVLRNLVSNAIKFTHPGGKVVLSAQRNRQNWVITVADNGVGIKEEALGKLFRIDESYSTLGTQNEKGTGLGLLLCKEFVEKNGGTIWVESIQNEQQEGNGSQFHFTVPKA